MSQNKYRCLYWVSLWMGYPLGCTMRCAYHGRHGIIVTPAQ